MTQVAEDHRDHFVTTHLGPREQPAWQTGILGDIASMLQTPVGREELGLLNANPSGHHTTIGPHLYSKGQLDPSNALSDPVNFAAATMLSTGKPNIGSDVNVHLNPHSNIFSNAWNWGVRGNEWMESTRSDVIGMHELTHALYQTLGLDEDAEVRQHDIGRKQRHNHSSHGVRIDARNHEVRAEHQASALGHYGGNAWGENPYRLQRLQMHGAPVGEIPSSPQNHDGDADMMIRTSYDGNPGHPHRHHRR